MRVRIIRNILSGNYEDHRINGQWTANQLLCHYNLSSECMVYGDGVAIQDKDALLKCKQVVFQMVPGMEALAVISIIVALGTLGYVAVTMSQIPDIPKVQTSPSLRGSTNNARKNQRLPILLGQHRVYPDVAALPFSSYSDNEQYLHQLFCFGYNDVTIDASTIKIGETLITSYEGCTTSLGFGTIYPSRMIESSIGLKLTNDGTATPVVRNTASGTYHVKVGLVAPSGIYRLDDDGNRQTCSFTATIEWRIPEGSWYTAFTVSKTLNSDKYREMFSIDVSGATDGIYEIRVTRTSAESTKSTYIDTVYYDVMDCMTRDSSNSTVPVVNASDFSLLSVKIKATNQLNGVVDSLNAMATLHARAYSGSGTGAASWVVGATRNPAACILYLLTDSINPDPAADSRILWEEFEEFYEFCEQQGFNCDAWITGDFTILQLCQYIAQANMAELRVASDSIGIRIDQANTVISQMFTPRNAWDFNMTMSFADIARNLRMKFVDSSIGYVEVERWVSANSENAIVFDSHQNGEDLEVSAFGVTSATHVAKLGAQRLKELLLRRRTFSWKSDIEGIICVPGDVVLISNDNFLIGLGEARVRKLIKSGSTSITGIVVDTPLRFEASLVFGVQIRNSSGVLQLKLEGASGMRKTLVFETAQSSGIEEGDLVSFGYYNRETHKVLITSMTFDVNRSCSFTAVDYAPEVYSSDETIPDYDPRISKYPEGDVGRGVSMLPSSGRKTVGAFIEDFNATRLGTETVAPPLGSAQVNDHITLVMDGGKKDGGGNWIRRPELNLAVIPDGETLDLNNPYKNSILHLEFEKEGKRRAIVLADNRGEISKDGISFAGINISNSEISGSRFGGQFIGEINSYGLISMPSIKGVTAKSVNWTESGTAYGEAMAWQMCTRAKALSLTEGQLYVCEITGEAGVFYCKFNGLSSLPSSWGNTDCNCSVEFWGKDSSGLTLLFWLKSECWWHTEWYSFLWDWGAYWATSGGRINPSSGGKDITPVSSVDDFLPTPETISGYGTYKNSGSPVGSASYSVLMVYSGSKALLSFPNMPQDLTDTVEGQIYVDASNYIRYHRPS